MAEDHRDRLGHVVGELEQALEASRQRLDELGHDDRLRRGAALEHAARYVELLAETGRDPRAGARFWFKLEYPDGRWDVAEQLLPTPPHVGDLVKLGDGSRWRVRETLLVRPRPARKPAQEFFVCTFAA